MSVRQWTERFPNRAVNRADSINHCAKEQTQPTDHPPSWRFNRTTKRRLRSHQAYQLREELDQLGARSFCSTLFMFIPHLCQALLTPPKPVKPLPTTRILRQRPCPCPAAD